MDDYSRNIQKPHQGNLILSDKPTTQKKQSMITPCKREQPKKLLQTQVDNKSFKLNKKFRQEYAVNMCLCNNSNNRKEQPKALQSVIVVDKLNKDSWKKNSSKEVASQMSSVRQTKPINSLILTTDVESFGKDKESTQISCLSNCICFHKMPSNTSIDRLLEYLTKSKCDLKTCDDKIKCINRSGFTVADITNKFITNCSSILKKPSKSNQQSAYGSKTLLNESKCIYSNKKLVNVTTEDNNVSNTLAMTTESEYMGAINLDKSNENFCKCVKDIKIPVLDTMSSKNNEGTTLKCINAIKCNCTQSETLIVDNTHTDKKLSGQAHEMKENKLDDLQITSKHELLNYEKLDKNSIVLGNILNINNKEQKDTISKDYDYHANFLGVSLASAGACPIKPNNKASKPLQSIQNDEENYLNYNLTKAFILPSSTQITSETQLKEKIILKKYNSLQSSTNSENILDRKTNFEGLERLIRGKRGTNLEKNEYLQNNFMEVDNTNLSPSNNEPCICCIKQDLEESENLEENTFQLIEEHLKEKFHEFKMSLCESTCIPPNEEDTFFSTLLYRVKEVISNYTKEMVCKCSDDENSKGSWTRACGLLEEYLKMKLKRVQCICQPASMNSDVMLNLNNVLEKVYHLIENDFDRLINTYNCTVNKNSTLKVNSMNTYIYPNDLPEKDQTNKLSVFLNKTNNYLNLGKESKKQSNKSMILSQSISLQVPQNLGMESKSCNAIDKVFKNTQTQESKDKLFNKNCKATVCNCLNTKNEEPFLGLLGRNELCVSHCIENKTNKAIVSRLIEKKSNISVLDNSFVNNINGIDYVDTEKCVKGQYFSQDTLPYVGKTVDCSCEGNISPCICMKSIVQTHNDEIVGIWNMLTQNIKCQQKNSYIMNSIIDRAQQEKSDILNLTADIYVGCLPGVNLFEGRPGSYDIKISPLQSNDIVLKTSNVTLSQFHRMTNTYSDYANIANEDSLPDSKQIDKIKSLIKFRQRSNCSEMITIRNSGSADLLNNTENKNLSSDHIVCDCNSIPICHVQMLMKNIEKKLVNSQCTCDSLTPKVCPIHSTLKFS